LARLTFKRITTATKKRAFQGLPQAENTGGDGQSLNHNKTLPGYFLSTQVGPQRRYRFHIYPDSSRYSSGGLWFLTLQRSAEFSCALLPQRGTACFNHHSVYILFPSLEPMKEVFCIHLAGRKFCCVKPTGMLGSALDMVAKCS